MYKSLKLQINYIWYLKLYKLFYYIYLKILNMTCLYKEFKFIAWKVSFQ